ncbi:SMC family protein [Rugamonas aquatica]|uniref:DNA repair protein n=1 Tax=Rugamonas aquatica TaxID=2743357 RepID=A0A6A7N6D0_9BURK|nr:DNA repair protein [Rugamonas aquatica]MQA40654.1 DNA repair protein [Rugamonas aquatica]
MIPYLLTLEGFTGIRDGLGREAITLDFESLCAGAQLIALAGPNGRGKSTILDNMTPYLIMPSHVKGALTGFSYYQHVCLPTARKLLEWGASDGQRYRSEVLIRSGQRNRTEAFLTRRCAGGWEPVCIADGTRSNGSVESYERCVAALIGSAATYFTSTFAAQCKRQLYTYENHEIKSLLADLLDQQQVRQVGKQAAEVVRLLRAGMLTLRHQLDGATAEAEAAAQTAAALPQARLAVGAAAKARDLRRGALEQSQRDLVQLRARFQSQARLIAQRDAMLQQRRELIGNGRKALAGIDQALEREQLGLSKLGTRATQRRQLEQQQATTLAARRMQLDGLLLQGATIARAARRLQLAQRSVQLRQQRVQHVQRERERAAGIEHERQLLQQQLNGIEREAGKAALDAEALTVRHRLTGQVPCSGMAMQAACQLLGEANQAKALLPSAQASVARLARQRASLQADIAAKCKLAAPLLPALAASRCEALLRRATVRSSTYAGRSALHPQLVQAVAERARLNTELAQARATSHACGTQEHAERQTHEQAIARLGKQKASEAARYRRQLDQLDKALAECEPEVRSDQVGRAAAAVDQAADELAQAEHALAAATSEQLRAAESAQLAAVLERRRRALQRSVSQVEDHIATWTLFAKCTGNDGLVALLIDDAGPALSSLANELLLACYGGRFTLAIATQVQSGEGWREGLAIMVHDADRGTSKNVELMSPGERVWINECLTRGIALYLAQQQSMRHLALFSDELDGALDPDRKRMFMDMKRTVLRIGGYRQEFFITQTPELAAMAEVKIDLDHYRLFKCGGEG